MKRSVILTAALLCVLSPKSFAEQREVFILAGQSNMEGQGVVSMDGEMLATHIPDARGRLVAITRARRIGS